MFKDTQAAPNNLAVFPTPQQPQPTVGPGTGRLYRALEHIVDVLQIHNNFYNFAHYSTDEHELMIQMKTQEKVENLTNLAKTHWTLHNLERSCHKSGPQRDYCAGTQNFTIYVHGVEFTIHLYAFRVNGGFTHNCDHCEMINNEVIDEQ